MFLTQLVVKQNIPRQVDGRNVVTAPPTYLQLTVLVGEEYHHWQAACKQTVHLKYTILICSNCNFLYEGSHISSAACYTVHNTHFLYIVHGSINTKKGIFKDKNIITLRGHMNIVSNKRPTF
jgi:hypothetical protein